MIKISYSGYRFPPEIIQHAIWLYIRFTLSFRDVEDLLAERGIMVSYETVRRWVNHFGPMVAADLRTMALPRSREMPLLRGQSLVRRVLVLDHSRKSSTPSNRRWRSMWKPSGSAVAIQMSRFHD
jgi:hypothetical protein